MTCLWGSGLAVSSTGSPQLLHPTCSDEAHTRAACKGFQDNSGGQRTDQLPPTKEATGVGDTV